MADNVILILDRDLGFLFWLGQTLYDAGYPALPARSVEEARALLREIEDSIGLLIADPSVHGADRLVQDLRLSHERLKVIAIATGPETPTLPGVQMWLRRPHSLDETSKSLWLEAIRTAFGPGAAHS